MVSLVLKSWWWSDWNLRYASLGYWIFEVEHWILRLGYWLFQNFVIRNSIFSIRHSSLEHWTFRLGYCHAVVPTGDILKLCYSIFNSDGNPPTRQRCLLGTFVLHSLYTAGYFLRPCVAFYLCYRNFVCSYYLNVKMQSLLVASKFIGRQTQAIITCQNREMIFIKPMVFFGVFNNLSISCESLPCI